MVAPRPYRFEWTDDAGVPHEHELTEGITRIGRAVTSDLVLSDAKVSGLHALVEVDGDAIVVHDEGSTNGTFLNDERIEAADLVAGDRLSLGATTLQLSGGPQLDRTVLLEPDADATVILDIATEADDAAPLAGVADTPPAAEAAATGEETRIVSGTPDSIVPPELLSEDLLSEEALRAAGVEVHRVDYLAVGGGIGSFVWVDALRSSGVPAEAIAVVGADEHPSDRYEMLCRNSQIPLHERLRSNSDSCPDNIWGFPGYAVREIWGAARRLQLRDAARTSWEIFGEPAIAQTYTPRAKDVFASIHREEERIGWSEMLRRGRIRAIRKSDAGRYIVIVSVSDATRRRHFAVSARFVQLAIGYPAIQLLPDLAAFREQYGDRETVVNAYEEHDHVYSTLRERGGTVLIRGRGIVASRVIQRLAEEHERNDSIQIIHLHRTRAGEGARFGRARRKVEHQFEFQPFNWPKAAWSGELRGDLESASDDERKVLLAVWGGTTTANRSDWREIIDRGTREGWYRSEFGVVREVGRDGDGRVATRISSSLAGGGSLELTTDYVIDCTGLVAKPDRSPLLGDLIERYDLPLNKLDRLAVANDFELSAMRHGDGRFYAAGAVTLGGPYAAVDSFLGLQYSALRAVRAMQRERPRAPHLRRLNGLYSLWQWTKWARGATP